MRALSRLLLYSILSVFICCCSKISEQQLLLNEYELNVTATGSVTKTIIDGTSIKWNANDMIGIYASGIQTNRCFTYSTQKDCFSGTFKSTGTSIESLEYYAYYPYTNRNITGTVISSSLNTVQSAPFDSSQDVMVSDILTSSYNETTPASLHFTFKQHLFAVIRIDITNTIESLKDDKIESVLIKADGVTLTGDYNFDIADGQIAVPSFTSNTSNKVTLLYPNDAQPVVGLNSPHTIYAIVNECTISKISVTINTNNHLGQVVSTFVSPIKIARSAVNRMNSIDLADAKMKRKKEYKYNCVFMGDSITEFWKSKRSSFFTDNNFLGKGISGQWTSHMLTRFQDDVINQNPICVIINGGVNNISHVYPDGDINQLVSDIKSMAKLALDAGIIPILTTICPTGGDFEKLEPQIVKANNLIVSYAKSKGLYLVDYHSALVGDDGYMPYEYATDGCHPTDAGYQIMEEICLPVIQEVIHLYN